MSDVATRIGRELRVPIAVWVATSAAVLVWATQSESVIYVAAVYIVLNGSSLAVAIWRDPPFGPRALLVMAWCMAVQLPTMIVLIFDGEGAQNPRKQRQRELREKLAEDPLPHGDHDLV